MLLESLANMKLKTLSSMCVQDDLMSHLNKNEINNQ